MHFHEILILPEVTFIDQSLSDTDKYNVTMLNKVYKYDSCLTALIKALDLQAY